MSIKELLQYGQNELKTANTTTPQLDAEVLLSFVLKKPKEWLYINDNLSFGSAQDRQLTIYNLQKYKKLIQRRKKHEPVAYITNNKEFFGLNFYVNKDVLIPRPETELLVEEVLKTLNGKQLKTNNKIITIADIGTGSGCIAITLAKHLNKGPTLAKTLTNFKIFATDISDKALKIAKINAQKNKILKNIIFLKGNLLSPIKNDIDILISNPPYVIYGQKVSKDVLFEPQKAVFIKNFDFFTDFFKQINKKLSSDGLAFIEIGKGQKQILNKIAKKEIKNAKITFLKDYSKIYRILKIKKGG